MNLRKILLKKLLTKLFRYIIINFVVEIQYADVAELADALDLGSSAFGVGVRLPSSALNNKSELFEIGKSCWEGSDLFFSL